MPTEQSEKAAIEKVLGLDKPVRENHYAKSRGTGELLPKELRELPADLVTKDAEDEDRVHVLDPAHIREALKNEYFDKLKEGEEPEPEKIDNEWRPVKQEFVDAVILRAMASIIETKKNRLARGWAIGPTVYHLWFPRNDITEYSLREGNPPANIRRPAHLKNIDLVVDIKEIQPRIKARIDEDPKSQAIYAGTLDKQIKNYLWEKQAEDLSQDGNNLIVPVEMF